MRQIYFNEEWGLNKRHLCKAIWFSWDFGVYSGCRSISIVVISLAPRQNYSRWVQPGSCMGLGLFILRWHTSVKMKAPLWQTAAAAAAAADTAQLYFVSVCVCTVYRLLPSRTGDLCVYTLRRLLWVYIWTCWVFAAIEAGRCYRATLCVQYLRLPPLKISTVIYSNTSWLFGGSSNPAFSWIQFAWRGHYPKRSVCP